MKSSEITKKMEREIEAAAVALGFSRRVPRGESSASSDMRRAAEARISTVRRTGRDFSPWRHFVCSWTRRSGTTAR